LGAVIEQARRYDHQKNPAIGGALTEHKSFSGGAGWWP
jgi:hypothetical protein